jgi:SSS family solute:Na+ symporter
MMMLADTATTFGALDWGTVGLYFMAIIGLVWWTSRKQDTTSDYFLAGRNVGWFVVGASIFASNIGSEHIVGLAGSGATSGMGMAHWELHAWVLIMLAWIFVPFYYRSGVFTMPEFLERRFSPRVRWLLSIVSLVAYVFTKVSVTVYAGGKVFGVVLPDVFGSPENAFYIGSLLTVVLTGLYTVLGGMRAVLFTDALQAFILLGGSIFITAFGLIKLGGWGELQAIANQNAQAFALWRNNSDPDFPWLGILLASPICGIWYWCTDQYIVQRTLAAKDLKNARRGALFGGLLKISPVLIFLVPGVIGYALHQKGIIQIPKVDGKLDGDRVFAVMVASLLPVGLRGLVVGGLLAALMSSLSALFNSCATLFTVDIYKKMRPDTPERKLVSVGRVATTIVMVLGILWIPIMPMVDKGGLYKYLQSVQSYLAPPITAVFLLGLFWKRINAHGAFWGLCIGFSIGMAKLLIQMLVGMGVFHLATPPESTSFLMRTFVAIGEYNFLFASGWICGTSVLIVIVASILTEKPVPEKIEGLCYQTLPEEFKAEKRASWDWRDIALTTAILAIVLGLYLYFSFWIG